MTSSTFHSNITNGSSSSSGSGSSGRLEDEGEESKGSSNVNQFQSHPPAAAAAPTAGDVDQKIQRDSIITNVHTDGKTSLSPSPTVSSLVSPAGTTTTTTVGASSSSSSSSSESNRNYQPRTPHGRSLHEHLHSELLQLIAVDDAPIANTSSSSILQSTPTFPSSSHNNTSPLLSPQTLLKKFTPIQLLHQSQNEKRRMNKIQVVNRLLDTLLLREDLTQLQQQGMQQQQSTTLERQVVPGRIHGCVGSYWELHPPIYEAGNGNNIMQAIDNNPSPSPRGPSLLMKGGGLRLPGLDIHKTFRKGYSILIWVRPTLVSSSPASSSSSPSIPSSPSPSNGNGNNEHAEEKDDHHFHSNLEANRYYANGQQPHTLPRPQGPTQPPRKQVLYRFATSPNDHSRNAVGVCALLGQWKAVPIPLLTMMSDPASPGGDTNNASGNTNHMTMLTTTLTAYTLPNNTDSVMASLFPVSQMETPSAASDSSTPTEEKDDEITTTSSDGGDTRSSNEMDLEKIPKSRLRGGVRSKGSTTTTNTTQQGAQRHPSQHHSQHPQVPSSSSTIRAPSSHLTTAVAATTTTTTTTGGCITGNITLPADEWSLITIQHTHPYLRRSELIVSVNGDEMMRGELGYPVLDSSSIGSGSSGGGSGSGIDGDSAVHNGEKGKISSAIEPDIQLDEHERQRLRGMGTLAECTLLDGAFDNGVESTEALVPTTASLTTKYCCSCIASVHSLALLSGPPVPDPVLALVAERGPLGDCSSSSFGGKTGLSFVVGPVPANPQNRDAIVSLSAGHGYYGSNPDGGGGNRGEGVGSGSSGGGIMGNPAGKGIHELTPPRSLGIPVSVGITPGVNPGAGGRGRIKGISGGNTNANETWIGGPDENGAHVTLQGLLGRVALTFHSADTKLYGGLVSKEKQHDRLATITKERRRRIVCPPSAAPSRIGGADAVPKVGIVRPIPQCPPLSSAGLEVTGHALYQNVTWNYIARERQRDCTLNIRPPLASSSTAYYSLEDNPPASFPRAIQAANTMNASLLPFRLALPYAGHEEVNDAQRKIHVESFQHLSDLLSNNCELASLLIGLITECIRCGGSSARDEALQSGIIHVLGTLVRKVLIRGARLGLLGSINSAVDISSSSHAVAGSSRTNNHVLGREQIDYDIDHDSSSPQFVPCSISGAIVGLIDACCGQAFGPMVAKNHQHPFSPVVTSPCRGVLRVRRTSDIALTALFGLAMDFDLIGNDASAAAPILKAIVDRYCQYESASPDQIRSFVGEDYGSFLRTQLNLQYFLDCIRIRFDHSLASHSRQLAQWPFVATQESNESAVTVVASSLSSILYTMLLSTLTSSTGLSVSRGERDVGALVASLTECPLGSLCAHVVTTAFASLLVKCGVLSSVCLDFLTVQTSSNQKKRIDRRPRNHNDLALESRLGRNMLLCHYHDIVAPLLLSRSSPRFSLQPKGIDSQNSTHPCVDLYPAERSYPLDWSHHWRLTLLTFAWLSSLSSAEERKSISASTGHLLLLAGEAGSLDGAFLGYRRSEKSAEDMMVVLSHFLVLDPKEKDNRAESISKRLSSFMQLLPGIVQSLLSVSVVRNKAPDDPTPEEKIISDESALAVGVLKQLLSMLSLAIQALYGSKRGGLLKVKGDTNNAVQLNRAKAVFVAGAKEYAPILLHVVALLTEPINLIKDWLNNHQMLSGRVNSSSQRPELTQRQRVDSTDKDWVDVHHAPPIEQLVTCNIPPADKVLPSGLTTPHLIPSADAGSVIRIELGIRPEKSISDHLCSVQDLAFYAASRLIAQAMKYGGGEASTAVWRSVVAALPTSKSSLTTLSVDLNENESGDAKACKDANRSIEPAQSRSTLCHLAALVLSKFSRRHEESRSSWNLETCSSVARLMDLVEEKQLLSSPHCGSSRKYDIDQVRLLIALLEVMASGRESGGWSQSSHPISHVSSQLEENPRRREHNNSNKGMNNGTGEEIYQQAKSSKVPSTSKLLLPILQSCVRIVLPATGVIRSEAVVITAATSNSSSKLLDLVCFEIHLSLVSAIEGLSFPIARDVFLNSIAVLRRTISRHENVGDTSAISACSTLVVEIMKSMRSRYLRESTRKERASFDAYEEDESSLDHCLKSESNLESSIPEKNASSSEGIHAQVIEQLISGVNAVPKNDADFVAFPGDASRDDDPSKIFLSPMGWSHYKGLGAAINRCFFEESTLETPEDKAQLVMNNLHSYIDNWDKVQIQDEAEAELVDLFDESIQLDSSSKDLIEDFNAHIPLNSLDSTKKPSSNLVTFLSASDAMARFIEAQSMLRQQHLHLGSGYLLHRRFGRIAFAERLCWNTWMDCIDSETNNQLWERAVNEGGRDFSSKLATVQVFPLFPRFIPSYLDHSPSSTSMDIKLVSQNIKIVDITKKEITEEMLQQFDSLNDYAMDETVSADFDEGDAEMATMDRNGVDFGLSTVDDSHTGEEELQALQDGNFSAETKLDATRENSATGPVALQQGSFHFAASSFSFPPDSSSLHSMGEGGRLGGGSMEEYYSSCLQVKPDCSLKCTLILTESHLIIDYDDGSGLADEENDTRHQVKQSELSHEEALKRDEEKHLNTAIHLKATRWNISEASHIYLRRYRLRDSALELFFIPSAGLTTGGCAFFAGSRSLFIDFGAGSWGNTRRDDAANAIMRRAPMQTVKQWPDKSGQFLHEELKKLMQAWSHGAISNFDYLLSLNILAGRSYNDICQYPVFPWVLSNYTSEEIPDLLDRANFRDLSKPMGALNEERLAELLDRFETFDDPTIPPFMYGSHYSTSAGVVIHFLLRLHPYSFLHRQLQSGHFDVADRLFSSVQRTWEMCTGRSAAEVKELTPEFYSNPAFLRNSNQFKLGTSQDGEVLGDVILPAWAKGSPERFIEIMRLALESDVCSDMLPDWIDLIFGRKQQGKAAIDAHNVFFYLTYYGSVDVASIENEGLRHATELQIAHFGQCPMQLFYRRHGKKHTRNPFRRHQTLSDLYDLKNAPLSAHLPLEQVASNIVDNNEDFLSRRAVPFMDAPLSHWIYLGAPPPGPHAPLVCTRLALADRCLAVDSKGIFHFFRWAWKPDFDDETSDGDSGTSHDDDSDKGGIFRDKGCFVTQRELFSFRNIPRLPYNGVNSSRHVTVAISKTMFANRSLLLVVSDGDGKGALGLQLVDPIKGEIRGEVLVPSIHADCITAIDLDPIGAALGQGGVGGELAIVGSADGSATLWRFISSHYWPLRPRLRVTGHGGAPIHAVAISSSLGVCASVSSKLCCIFDIGNGVMIRNFTPPKVGRSEEIEHEIETTFADTAAFCLSILGYLVAVCSTKYMINGDKVKEEFSLELFTVEGRHVSSFQLGQLSGIPKKIFPTADGRAVFVCAEGGVSIHLVSSIRPLAVVDRWIISGAPGFASTEQVVYDLDFGPTISRPVVAAAGCSAGALRLHALQGISLWSQEHQRNTVSSAVGSVLALPAQTVKNALGGVSSFGSSFFGSAKEISKEAFSVVKEREGGFFFRKKRG